MKKALLLFLVITAIGGGLSPAATIKLDDDGQLDIDIPATWKTTVNGDSSDGEITYEIGVFPDDNSRLMCGINLTADPQLSRVTRESSLKELQQQGAIDAVNSVEKKATVIPLDITNGFGFYYVLTKAKVTGTNEYKAIGRFAMKYGTNLLAAVSVFSDDTNSVEFQNVKNAIIGMRPVLNLPPPLPKIQISKVEQGTQISSDASPKILIIPSKNLKVIKPRMGGGTDNPGYFYFQNANTAVLISGWFEPAGNFRSPSAKEMWKSGFADMAKAGGPSPINDEYQKIGDWDVYLYDMIPPATFKSGRNTNLRANYLDEKIWIDLHLSLTQDRPSQELRETLTAYLKTFILTNAVPGQQPAK